MSVFLDDFSRSRAKNVHAVMIIDGAGWHNADDLIIPENVSLYCLPPYSPELNPIEQVWGYLKSNFLSGRIFHGLEDIFDHGVMAWRQLSDSIVKSICAGTTV